MAFEISFNKLFIKINEFRNSFVLFKNILTKIYCRFSKFYLIFFQPFVFRFNILKPQFHFIEKNLFFEFYLQVIFL